MMKRAVSFLALSSCAIFGSASAAEPEADPKKASFVGVRPGRFAGKVCFVTGSTSGIGEHSAYHLAQEGCAVAVTGRREDRGAAVVEHINSLSGISTLNPPAIFIKLDVTSDESMKAAVDKIGETWGRLDAVFANAGVAAPTIVGDPAAQGAFDWVTSVNINGVFRTVAQSAPLMMKTGGGNYVLCSSIYGLRATPYFTGYIASKHALEGMKKALAGEFLQYNIRVNNLNPSFTPSELTEGFMALPPFRERVMNEMQPDRKLAELSETSSTTAFLLSTDSQYINGVSIPVDGNMVNMPMNPDSFMSAANEGFAIVAEMEAAAKAKQDL